MSDSDRNGPIQGQKLVFSSEQLPPQLDDRDRFNLWRDLFVANAGACDISNSGGRPFSSTLEFTQFGAIGITRLHTTSEGWSRTSRHAAADAREEMLIGFNRGQGRQLLSQRSREVVLGPGQLALYINTQSLAARNDEEMRLVGLRLPLDMLRERVRGADNLVVSPLDESSAAAWHLRRYLDFLLDADGFRGDRALIAHVEATLLDLVVLALGAAGESAEIARFRGLRAARLREILAAIKAGFADAALTADTVGARLGLSGRYVQNLLSETGVSFTERVVELRLQQARAMLADPRNDRLKVNEIALACGFNEVSYFNRCFRRRFGASPTQHRGGNAGVS